MRSQPKHPSSLTLAFSSLLLIMVSPCLWAEEAQRWQVNMTPGATQVGAQIYNLHMAIVWLCIVIGVAVFAVMMISLIYHRKSRGHQPASFHENVTLELTWTIIPFIILIVIAFPATKTLLNIYDTDEADVDIIVTAYQWKWKYEYLDPDGNNVAFFSNLLTDQAEIDNEAPKGEYYLLTVDEPLVVPVNKKVRLLVTANDVIHSWWVPSLAVKKDAIPGFINEAWTKVDTPGIYRGQCAELCGRGHGFMPIVVQALEENDYQAWLQDKQVEAAKIKELIDKQFTLEEQMTAGKVIYDRSCAACHGTKGQGGIGAALAGSALATGEVKAHIDSVVNGVPGTAMQAFGEQLNDVDMAAVITFERNAFGNNMGNIVQPIDIYQFKGASKN